MATAEGTPPAAEAADDSANAPATLPPLKDTPAVPDLEEPPAQDEDEEGHHPQPQPHPHDHSHEENNTPNGNGAQPNEKTGDEKTPPNATDADSPGAKATSASNKRPPSEADLAARNKMRKQSSAFALSEAIMLDPASVVDHEARQLQWAELFNEALMSYQDVSIAAVVASITCILYVSMMANSGPYLKGGDDHTSEAASLYSFSNHTNTNTTLCPEMGGLESQRGATLDAQKIFLFMGGLSMGVLGIAINCIALVRHLSFLTVTKSQPGLMIWITQ
jgi:hypothetical protein